MNVACVVSQHDQGEIEQEKRDKGKETETKEEKEGTGSYDSSGENGGHARASRMHSPEDTMSRCEERNRSQN